MYFGSRKNPFSGMLLSLIGIGITPAYSAVIGGVEFPQGDISFADTVVAYSPGLVGANPTQPHRGTFNALGLPDYSSGTDCSTQELCTYVSLGDGGSIELRFTDNLLTRSGDSALDLWIFEVGPDVEDTFVDISADGTTWYPVGKVSGSTAGIDIDAADLGSANFFSFVRLRDDTGEGQQNSATVGADIDAVGAISTAPAIPEPGSVGLIGSGLILLLGIRRLFQRR